MKTPTLFAVFSALFWIACDASPRDRPVTYGGEKWSLVDIFPLGPNRDLAGAAADGDIRGMERALKQGADVNFKGKYEFTPLWWAAWDQNIHGFVRLLELGADPNIVPTANSPVMHNVSEAFWKPAFLKGALSHGGNPNLQDRSGVSPLGRAITQGTSEHVRLLLDAGAKIENRSDGSDSQVFTAVVAGRFDYLLDFLQRGADPLVRDRNGHDIAYMIGLFPYDPDSEHYVWRERVIRFLRAKGIEAHHPSSERKRTKPLPPDLQ